MRLVEFNISSSRPRVPTGREQEVPPGNSGKVKPKPIPAKEVWPIDSKVNDQGHFGIRPRGRHNGVDLYAVEGTPVKAPVTGTITVAGWDNNGGNVIAITADTGRVIHKLMHLSQIKVKLYDKVSAGTVIALSGATGKMINGAHLHWEKWQNGIPVDPTK